MKRERMRSAADATRRAASEKAAPAVQKGIEYLRRDPELVARSARKVAPRLGRYGKMAVRAGDLATAALKAMAAQDRDAPRRRRD